MTIYDKSLRSYCNNEGEDVDSIDLLYITYEDPFRGTPHIASTTIFRGLLPSRCSVLLDDPDTPPLPTLSVRIYPWLPVSIPGDSDPLVSFRSSLPKLESSACVLLRLS